MHSLGLSLSYKRVLEISSELAAKACRQFQHDKVVCPMKLRHGLFTTAAVDNIDHNPSSTTSNDSFHGTAISLFQHPSEHCKGSERILSPELEVETISKTLSAAELPDFFTSIPPFLLKMPVEPPQPHIANLSTDNCRFTENGVLGDVLKQAISSELDWMEAVPSADTDCVSWGGGAFHASKSQQNDLPHQEYLLPLFHQSSKSPAMRKHAMDLVMQAVKFLNPGQIPVITADQPLFAIAKQIQWKCPEFYRENKIALLLGGLHIGMSFLKTVGTLLKDSEWVEALVNAKVDTSGCAESFLNGSHVTRTRRAHQLTACALFMLKHAYRQYSLSCAALEENVLCFEDWKESMITTSPTFKYWTLVLQLEMILLVFVASLRDGNFLHVTAEIKTSGHSRPVIVGQQLNGSLRGPPPNEPLYCVAVPFYTVNDFISER
ncbi:hypothetical protein Bpfe_015336 [Biomphalaria pfeifferi]|uniref:Uncharacterized protein n=1 Tax=Biomphalaria pfeifferi TaxID=112525 RepID=A0AAD8F890_BIOPF|nr:hypothetical protein Bpfe_015336 [Biomphalaria pfeifferi]